jgi:hypothetical protein
MATIPQYVQYAGVALTRIATQTLPTATSAAYVYRLKDPAAGANNVVIQLDVGLQQAIIGAAISFSGADQETGTAVATGTSAAPSVTVATQAGHVVVGAVGSDEFNTSTVGSDEAERWDLNQPGSGGDVTAWGCTQPGESGGVIAPTLSVSTEWAAIAVSIPPRPTVYLNNRGSRPRPFAPGLAR